MSYCVQDCIRKIKNHFVHYADFNISMLREDRYTKHIRWYSRKVTNFKHVVFNSGMLVNCFMEHQVLTYSLHFN